ncbi:DeoR/GlpR family DNA-binding transcription regulator [Nesterenkonia sp.]|uniref:DeoR/GlpR family DNA-binding transcription regulator n=1 Tax=Nesterenkonia sp. TaxID=704201 RepID=UPI00261435AC|nr:DeoR/GlpR family DNA-binding transcription regulator [Nesterenkonia sp.]
MLAAERQARITERVAERGSVRVADLVEEFGVSDMTVRRDLDVLASQGVLSKVHGGAVPAARRSEEPGFAAKATRMEREKDAIAAEAAQLVEPGMSIALSAGTTTRALARRLTDVPELTVITNSTRISDVFHQAPRADRTVILTGGIRTRSDALVGPTAVAALRHTHVDLAFLGAHGISEEAGFTTPNYLEADTNAALIASARRTAVLADHSKWGVIGVMTFAALTAADTLISDQNLHPAAVAALSEHIGDLRLAETGPARADQSPGQSPHPTAPQEADQP